MAPPKIIITRNPTLASVFSRPAVAREKIHGHIIEQDLHLKLRKQQLYL